MEELQSTEILDREILEDARKKAHRILKAADETIQAKTAEWEQKLAADIDELERKNAQQCKFSTEEIMSRLPIDKHRIKIKKMEALLNSAAEDWYTNLDRDYVLELLAKELAKRIAVCAPSKESAGIAVPDGSRIFIRNMKQAETETILKKIFPEKSWVIETMYADSIYPEIILDTPELRIYASLKKIVEWYLSEKRAELVEALIGSEDMLGEIEFAGGEP